MPRSRHPTAGEIRRLLLFLLGRAPSDRALAELSQRPLEVSAGLILLGAEFEGLVRRGLLGGEELPHHRYEYAPTDMELEWLGAVLALAPDSIAILPSTRDWLGLLAVLMRDPGLAAQLRQEFPEHARLDAFDRLQAEVQAAHASLAAAAALASPRGTAVPKPAPPTAPAPPPPPRPAAPPRPATPPPPPPLPPSLAEAPRLRPAADAPKPLPHVSGPALDLAVAEAAWQRLLADPADPLLRGELYGAFRRNEKLVLYLNARLDEVPPGRCAPHDALVRMLAARLYLRLFMGRSAMHAARAAMAADAAAPGALRDSDRNRLAKTLATAALRSGLVEDATAVLQDLVRDDPLDWEALLALAEIRSTTDAPAAAELYALALHLNPDLGPGARLAVAEFAEANGDRLAARKIVLDLLRAGVAVPECHLALGNMALTDGDPATWRARARQFFSAQSLAPPEFGAAAEADHLFTIGAARLPRQDDHPLVTVVTTAFNAASTIAASLRSVLDQSFGNLELLVVDDCSTDATPEIVAALAARDPRLRLLRNPVNTGTYCAKNRAIGEARGAFVTLHDSDDWMHPQRLERHLEAMALGTPAASLSNWVRMDGAGRAVLRKGGGGYIHRNPASAFLRRETFGRIGLFDSVRVGADSELLWRIRHALGPHAIADVEASLGLGLHHENSLTQSGVTAFDEFRFSPVRLEYAEAWGRWQIESLNRGQQMFLGFPLRSRPFEAPAAIMVPGDLAEAAIGLAAAAGQT